MHGSMAGWHGKAIRQDRVRPRQEYEHPQPSEKAEVETMLCFRDVCVHFTKNE